MFHFLTQKKIIKEFKILTKIKNKLKSETNVIKNGKR